MRNRLSFFGRLSGGRCCVTLLLGALVSACATAPRLESVPAPSTAPAVESADEAPATVALPGAAPPPAPLVPIPMPPSSAVGPAQMLNIEDFIERNDENLLHIYVGMSRVTVDRIMGSYRTGAHANPYKRQLIAGSGGQVHEVLFYLTRKPRTGQRITESVLTPVVVADERVTAIGRYPLKKLRRAACQARGETNCP